MSGKGGGLTKIECENQQGERVVLAQAKGGTGTWDGQGWGGSYDINDSYVVDLLAYRNGGQGGWGTMGAWGTGTAGDSQAG